MIASAIIQSVLLLSSGGFNVLLNPGSLSVEKQLFVSSVILIIGFAQGMLIVLIKVLIRLVTGWDIHCGVRFLFAPLASAMSKPINDRPGETDVTTPIVTKLSPSRDTNTVPEIDSDVHDGFDTDDDDCEPVASHFMPELEMAISEKRNVYTDIYLLGIATFTATYCIDTVSPAPTTAFLSGLLIMSVTQSVNIVVILFRARPTGLDTVLTRIMRGKRLLTLTSCVFATGSFVVFCVGLGNAQADTTEVTSIFDVTFSIILPLIAPWLLVTVSPKQHPLRTFFECTPFVFTICFSFVLFFLATRGQISTIIHDLTAASQKRHNGTSMLNPDNGTSMMNLDSIVDIEFHSDVNASLHFNMDIFSTTSVDGAGNIPMLLCAPLIKIPTMVVVLANVINRSNLVVITALLVTMSMREMSDLTTTDFTHRAYSVAFALSCVSLFFNILKYMKIPDFILGLGDKHTSRSDIRHDGDEGICESP
jgi:hypothetical protein